MTEQQKRDKAAWHDAQVRYFEACLQLPLTDANRDLAQRQLLHHARAANELRNPHKVTGDRMRSYVGLSEYYFNG